MKKLVRLILFVAVLGPCMHLSAQKTALILIDIQEFYFPGGRVQLENPEEAGVNAGLLLKFFREEGLPLVHVRHNFEPGGSIHEYVRPLEGEKIISKDHVNAFIGTDLQDCLESDSVKQLVICGMQTHMCVEAAVRAAKDMGYSCILAGDACATRALQYEEHIVPAQSVHLSTLRTLEGAYARVLSTDECIKEISNTTE